MRERARASNEKRWRKESETEKKRIANRRRSTEWNEEEMEDDANKQWDKMSKWSEPEKKSGKRIRCCLCHSLDCILKCMPMAASVRPIADKYLYITYICIGTYKHIANEETYELRINNKRKRRWKKTRRKKWSERRIKEMTLLLGWCCWCCCCSVRLKRQKHVDRTWMCSDDGLRAVAMSLSSSPFGVCKCVCVCRCIIL